MKCECCGCNNNVIGNMKICSYHLHLMVFNVKPPRSNRCRVVNCNKIRMHGEIVCHKHYYISYKLCEYYESYQCHDIIHNVQIYSWTINQIDDEFEKLTGTDIVELQPRNKYFPAYIIV